MIVFFGNCGIYVNLYSSLDSIDILIIILLETQESPSN